MTEEQYWLLLLEEECNEIGQRASKTFRFGWDEIEPDQPKNNKERLEEELIDLFSIISMLADQCHLSPEFLLKCYLERDMVDRMNIKEAKIEKYKEYSQKIGRIEIKN